MGIQATSSVIHLLHNFPALAELIADLITLFVNKYNSPQMVSHVLREIGRIDTVILSRDSSGAKGVTTFLDILSDKLPKVVLSHLSLLMPHLDGESYIIRNGVVKTITNLIQKAFQDEQKDEKDEIKDKSSENKVNDDDMDESVGSDLDQNNFLYRKDKKLKSREALLNVLRERVHDITSFTRSKVLQGWIQLAKAKSIPLHYQSIVVQIAVDRLRDKACQVRKYAIVLLITLLNYNPFSPNLSIEPFKRQLEERAL